MGVTPDYVSASAAEVVTTRDLGRVVVVNMCGIQVVAYSAHKAKLSHGRGWMKNFTSAMPL